MAHYAVTLAAEQSRRGHCVEFWGRSDSPVLADAQRNGLTVRGWEGGAGARLLIDHSQGVPLTLVLEHLSPRHAERSVGQLGLLLQTLPLPPRLRIRFSQCPEGPSSRHHMVGKALGAVLDPGCFKAVATTDQVDVMFLSPDPRWRTDW